MRASSAFRALLLVSAATASQFHALAQTGESGSAEASATSTATVQIDPRWGILAELAERDFMLTGALGTIPATVRWDVVNEKLIWTDWGPARSVKPYTLDAAAGTIGLVVPSMFGSSEFTLEVNASGELSRVAGEKRERFLWKAEDGSYKLRWGPGTTWTYVPAEAAPEKTAKLHQLLAEGKVRARTPGLTMTASRPSMGSAPLLAAAQSPGQKIPPPGIEADYPFLDPGEAVTGRLTEAHDCYLLETRPDSPWSVTLTGDFDTFLTVGTGTSCPSVRRMVAKDDSGNNRTSRVDFTAAGGVYTVQVSGYANSKGTYSLVARPGEVRGKKLGPGLAIVRVNDPTFAGGMSASTAPLSGAAVPVAGTQIQGCAECPALVVIKPGSFMMGSSAAEIGHEAHEGPRHMVTFAQPFAIGKHEVTFDEWDACVKDKGCSHTPADMAWGRGRRPVVNVSWKDAMQYVRWLRRKTGQNYYLPSEAEWEYAARAGAQTPWNTGKAIITDDANLLNALGRTVPVGGYPANAFGVHDMHGNVREWVADCYDVGYFGVPVNGGAAFNKACTQIVLRDGSYLDGVSKSRSANRQAVPSDGRFRNAGFRVARGL